VVTSTTGACALASWSAAATLADGSYTVKASQTDAAGHTGTSATVAFKVDTVAPIVTVTFPVNGARYNTTRYTAGCSPVGACGSASDATSGVASVTGTIQRSSDSFFWNGSAWQSGTFTLTATGTTAWNIPLAVANLTNGVTYTVTARATDNGGLSSTATSTFTYDTSGPAVTGAAVTNHTNTIEATLDTLAVTFNENIDPASVPSSATLTLNRPGSGNTTYAISGLTNGAQPTAAKGYLNSGGFTVSYAGTLTVVGSVVTFTVSSPATCSGSCTQLSGVAGGLAGAWQLAPSSSILDLAGNAAVTGTVFTHSSEIMF
jgi:hypothetical protein